MKPLVSVLIPVYNCEKYIYQAISSILRQTFKKFELIVIDGGSTDNTLGIIQLIRDRRLKVIERRGLNIPRCRNEGLYYSDAKLIALQDSDDLSDYERLAKQYLRFCSDKNLVVLGTSYYLINENGEIIGKKLLKEKITLEDFRRGMQLCNGSVMFRKDVIIKEGLFDPLFAQCEDYELYCRLSKKGYKIANLNKFLYYLRIHENSISAKKWQEQLLYTYLVRDIYFGNLKKEQIKYALSVDPKNLYSLLSQEAKIDYHLSIAQRRIESKQYCKGLTEFLKIAKLNPEKAMRLMIAAAKNPNKVLQNMW